MSTRIDTTTGRTGPFHPVNVTHLVMGLVFLGIAGAWALRQLGVIDADGDRWVLPGILVLAGAAGLAAAVARGLSRDKDQPVDQPVDQPSDEPAEPAEPPPYPVGDDGSEFPRTL